MAIAQTGSATSVGGPAYAAASGVIPTASTITVPADAELMLIGVGAFSGTANLLKANGTFSITGGNASIGASGGGDDTSGGWKAALHYILIGASTGTQTLNCVWDGTAPGTAMDDTSVIISWTFWKGIDTASPTRHSGGEMAFAATTVTPTLTAQATDLIVAFTAAYTDPEGDATINFSGSGGAAALSQVPRYAYSDGAWGTASPTGNQTITTTATVATVTEIAMAAFVLKAAATGGPDLTVTIQEPTISITTF